MKPKLHCTSLFTTGEFPESPAIKYFPYPWQSPQPQAPVGVPCVLLAKKMSHNSTAATVWSCATVVWTSGQLTLLTNQWQPSLVNRQRDPCVQWTSRGPSGRRAEQRGTCKACCDQVPTSHKERRQMSAEPSNTHLCCLRQQKFSISALLSSVTSPLHPLTRSFFSHAVQAATVCTKS